MMELISVRNILKTNILEKSWPNYIVHKEKCKSYVETVMYGINMMTLSRKLFIVIEIDLFNEYLMDQNSRNQ